MLSYILTSWTVSYPTVLNTQFANNVRLQSAILDEVARNMVNSPEPSQSDIEN